jgi:predicted amidophosphoribosyltransferase
MEGLPGYDSWKLREPPDYGREDECPNCGYLWNPPVCKRCGYVDSGIEDNAPVCSRCGGAIAEDGQCQDCLLYYPEHDQERG